jgi:hypothetical protein
MQAPGPPGPYLACPLMPPSRPGLLETANESLGLSDTGRADFNGSREGDGEPGVLTPG